MTGQLYYMIGIPRSGKTTFARKWLNYEYTITGHDLFHSSKFEYDNKKQPELSPRTVVCEDDIRKALTNQAFVGEAERMVLAVRDIMARSLLIAGVDVLLDDTHTSWYSQRAVHALQYNAIYVYIHADPEICIQRAYATDQAYLEKPIHRMVANLKGIRDQLEEYRGTGIDPPFLKKIKETL